MPGIAEESEHEDAITNSSAGNRCHHRRFRDTRRAQSDPKGKTGIAPAKTKVYKFRSMDYPGYNLSTVMAYEGGIAVGVTSHGDGTEIGFAYRVRPTASYPIPAR